LVPFRGAETHVVRAAVDDFDALGGQCLSRFAFEPRGSVNALPTGGAGRLHPVCLSLRLLQSPFVHSSESPVFTAACATVVLLATPLNHYRSLEFELVDSVKRCNLSKLRGCGRMVHAVRVPVEWEVVLSKGSVNSTEAKDPDDPGLCANMYSTNPCDTSAGA